MSWKGLKSSGLVSYRSVNSISLKIILVYHLEILNKPFLFEIVQKIHSVHGFRNLQMELFNWMLTKMSFEEMSRR